MLLNNLFIDDFCRLIVQSQFAFIDALGANHLLLLDQEVVQLFILMLGADEFVLE